MNYKELEKLAFSEKGLSANFTGINNKKTKKQMKTIKEFSYHIKNETSKDLVYAICTGTFSKGCMGGIPPADLMEIQQSYKDVDACAGDGVIYTEMVNNVSKNCEITVNGSKTFAHFHRYFNAISGVINDIELSSSDKRNFQMPVKVGLSSPLDTQPMDSVPLRRYFSLGQQDQNRLIAKGINVPVGPLCVTLFTIAANSEKDVILSFTFLN